MFSKSAYQTSDFVEKERSLIDSGAIHLSELVLLTLVCASHARDMPKSVTFGTSARSSRMLCADKLRCTSCERCRCAMPLLTPRNTLSIVAALIISSLCRNSYSEPFSTNSSTMCIL